MCKTNTKACSMPGCPNVRGLGIYRLPICRRLLLQGRKVFVVDDRVHPQNIEIVRTRAGPFEIEVSVHCRPVCITCLCAQRGGRTCQAWATDNVLLL